MYRHELLPQCLATGLTEDRFWQSYPREIEPYFEALKIRRKMEDEAQYMQYIYYSNAVEVALGNAFRKKGSKPYEHIQEPLMAKYEKEHHELTETEKKSSVELLFASLGKMQENFERSKQKTAGL